MGWKTFNVTGVQVEGRLNLISKYTMRGSNLYLERDPDNEYSKTAIKVMQRFKNGGQVCLGFVPDNDRKPLARELAPRMDAGWEPNVKFGMKFIKVIDEETTECTGLQLRYEVEGG